MPCFIWGAIEISGERFATWGGESTAQIWHFDGTKGTTLIGHCPPRTKQELNCEVDGVLELQDGRLLTWSDDGTARIWSREGEQMSVLLGHCQTNFNEEHCYVEAMEMSDGRIVTWSNDHKIIVWNSDGVQSAILSGHCPPPDSANSNCRVGGVLELSDGVLVSSSYDGTVRFWPSDVKELLTRVDVVLSKLEPLGQEELCEYGIEEKQNCPQ